MRLYTVQPRLVYDTLCSTGIFLPQPWKAGDDWIGTDEPQVKLAYDWLCDEMVRRGLARPNPNTYPVWAWHRYQGEHKPKPDLRCADMKHYARSGTQVLLSLNVPDEDVLLHDYYAWHHPLNYFYLATQRASERFERRCKAAGHPLYTGAPLADEVLHAELQQSWHLIFDLPAIRRLMRIPRAEQAVQATFWALHARHVSAVVEFGHGAPRRTLPLPQPIFNGAG